MTDVQVHMGGGNICDAAAQMFPELNGLFQGDITFHKTWRIEPSTVHIRYALRDSKYLIFRVRPGVATLQACWEEQKECRMSPVLGSERQTGVGTSREDRVEKS